MSEPPSPLTHFPGGRPLMVDVSAKTSSLRTARAEAHILLPAPARAALEAGSVKGDPLTVAQLAGTSVLFKASGTIFVPERSLVVLAV